MKKILCFAYVLCLLLLPISLEAIAIVAGTITDSSTGLPISGALVEAIRNSQVKGSDTTDADGDYSIDVNPGSNYSIVAIATGFQSQAIGAQLKNNETTIINFSLIPNSGTIAGTVVDNLSNPISGALIEIF